MSDLGGRHEVEIETVAEVQAVARESVTILFHDDERIIQMLADQRYGDIVSITFPVARAPAVIAALQTIVDAEGAPPAK